MENVGVVSYASCAIGFFILLLILTTSWQGGRQGGALLVATVTTVIWAGLSAYQATQASPISIPLVIVEIGKDLTWLTFLFLLLHQQLHNSIYLKRMVRMAAITVAPLLIIIAILSAAAFKWLNLPVGLGFKTWSLALVMTAVIGLILVEQIFRNASQDKRWSLKYLCLAVGGMFAYDFYLYADAVLFEHLDRVIWEARGVIHLIVVPLIAVSAARNPQWLLDVYVSRQFVFHTTTLVAAGVYLLAMAAGGYYIKLYGGTWGAVAQLVFFFGAVVLLGILLFSGQMRARMRVLLNKHFFNYRYDYREEILKFINTLSDESGNLLLRQRVIRAIAEIVESPGGMLWRLRDEREYQLVETLNLSCEGISTNFDAQDSLMRFLNKKHWVVDIADCLADPPLYDNVELPAWLQELPKAWLIVPLVLQNKMHGFLLLAKPRAPMSINWETRDMLKTTGRQAANYLALLDANEALIDARQFDAFNRLSAYVVHDLKNICAQLNLIVNNAQHHRQNPAFIDDAFNTVENAVNKMNRMLGQLRKSRSLENFNSSHTQVPAVDIVKLIRDVVQRRQAYLPNPTFNTQLDSVLLTVEQDRFSAVMEHLIQNAQEATSEGGKVSINISRVNENILIHVQDDGCGMDERFVRERLFKPFETTKGNSGMGIGVYESREFIIASGGRIDVASRPGKGTLFTLIFKENNDKHAQSTQTH